MEGRQKRIVFFFYTILLENIFLEQMPLWWWFSDALSLSLSLVYFASESKQDEKSFPTVSKLLVSQGSDVKQGDDLCKVSGILPKLSHISFLFYCILFYN